LLAQRRSRVKTEKEDSKRARARLQGREYNNGGLRTHRETGDDDGEGGGRGIAGGDSGDVLAKVMAGNAVYVRRSKVACRVAEFSFSSRPSLFSSAARSLGLPALSDAATVPLPPAVLYPSSSLSLFLSGPRGVAQTAGMHQMHRALTDARPRSTASTCLLRPFASLLRPRSFSLSSLHPFAVIRFFFPQSATPPPRTTLASFTSFCRRHCCHSREWPASLYHRVMVHFFFSTPSQDDRTSYTHVCARTHTQARADSGSTLRRRVVSRVVAGNRTSRRTSQRPFSRPPAALSLSLFLSSARLAFFAAVSFDRASFYAPVPG